MGGDLRGQRPPELIQRTSTAPHAPYETDFVTYRLGAVGPSATYEVQNVRGEVNTGMTGTTAGHYFIDAHIDSGFPNVNASFDQW